VEHSDVGCKVVVCYGHPEDPDVFDAHYRDVHLPLARRITDVGDFATGGVTMYAQEEESVLGPVGAE
jgi:uncharacterized protein (TIGR02118 family)